MTNNGVKSNPIMVDTSKGGDTFVPHHFWLILLFPKSMDGLLSVMFFFGGGGSCTRLGGGFGVTI